MTLTESLDIVAKLLGVMAFILASIGAYVRYVSKGDSVSQKLDSRVDALDRRIQDLESRSAEKFREMAVQISKMETKQDEANKNAQLFQLSITKDVAVVFAGVNALHSEK